MKELIKDFMDAFTGYTKFERDKLQKENARLRKYLDIHMESNAALVYGDPPHIDNYKGDLPEGIYNWEIPYYLLFGKLPEPRAHPPE